MKLTFKQYLETKAQLRKAIENTPVSIVEYDVAKYCSIPLGETEEDRVLVSLKPKHKIIVEWRHDNVDNPTPTSIKIDGVQNIDADEIHETFWTGNKLQKWLARHASIGKNSGHKI